MTFGRDEVALRRMTPSRVVVVRTPWCSIGNAHGVGVFRLGRAPSLKMTVRSAKYEINATQLPTHRATDWAVRRARLLLRWRER
jgi:hypothetical protein